MRWYEKGKIYCNQLSTNNEKMKFPELSPQNISDGEHIMKVWIEEDDEEEKEEEEEGDDDHRNHINNLLYRNNEIVCFIEVKYSTYSLNLLSNNKKSENILKEETFYYAPISNISNKKSNNI